MTSLPKKQCEELAKAIGLDPSTPYDAIIEHINGVKQRNQSLEKMGDWRHLLTDGVATDCTIQVHITKNDDDATASKSSSSTPGAGDGPPPMKRARTSRGSGATSSDVLPSDHTIKAHSVILGSRSEYFKAVLMRGQWAESQDKTIEVELPSKEALEAFKLLLELSYGVDYTRRPSSSSSDGPSTTFDPNTLVQLISVANMFEFLSCIESCCEQLHGMEGWDVDMALGIINELGSLADTHESVGRLLEKAVKKVGLLEGLWRQGPWSDKGARHAVKAAKVDLIKALTSVDALVCLLKSDKLAMHSENTTFTLVHYWLMTREDWDDAKKQSTFDTIMDSQALRFEHMDPTYLALFALRTSWLSGHERAAEVVQRALMVRSGAVRVDEGTGSIPKSRAKVQSNGQGESTYQLEARMAKQDFVPVVKEGLLNRFLGLAAGFPILFRVKNGPMEEGGGGSKMGMYVAWSTGGLPQGGGEGNKLLGALCMGYTFVTSPIAARDSTLVRNRNEDKPFCKSADNIFRKSWDEVMAEGSPYFTPDEGTMEVKVEVKLKGL